MIYDYYRPKGRRYRKAPDMLAEAKTILPVKRILCYNSNKLMLKVRKCRKKAKKRFW